MTIGRILAALCLAGLCACAKAGGSDSAQAGADQPSGTSARLREADLHSEQDNLKRLDGLWQARTQSTATGDYPIQAGDVLQISAPGMPEVGERTERVSGDGTINLPMAGVISASGLSEEKLREAIADRLQKYMYHPQVDVFVKEYRSRQAAVVGAVKAPGLLTLASPSETVLDVITRAGGMSGDAADEIVLIPAEQSQQANDRRVSSIAALTQAANPALTAAGSSARTELTAKEAMSLIPASSQPIVIALHSTSLSGAGRYLNLPVRPGDVIVVPGGGDVMVVGWVQNPGHLRVGSGLTVLGAVSAAGGPMYAASLGSVRLIRTEQDGGKRMIPIDLAAIMDGGQADPPVEGNDVIDVPYSMLKIGPYIVYSILTRLGYGVGIPVPVP